MKHRDRKHRKGFTEKQMDVVELQLRGLTAKEISQQLKINPKALKWRCTYIYLKTGTRGVIDLLATALDMGVNPKSRKSIERLLLPEYKERTSYDEHNHLPC